MPLGFNCGEAANIATPEWLGFAKDAAIRRASINYPPMVSHYQLLYDLAVALCSRYLFCDSKLHVVTLFSCLPICCFVPPFLSTVESIICCQGSLPSGHQKI